MKPLKICLNTNYQDMALDYHKLIPNADSMLNPERGGAHRYADIWSDPTAQVYAPENRYLHRKVQAPGKRDVSKW